jgi:hypothetical protein
VEKSYAYAVVITACLCVKRIEIIKASAYQAVTKAILNGELPIINTRYCVDCGAFATKYDHRDYSQPLLVEPVCNSCNRKRGPATWHKETIEAESIGVKSATMKKADVVKFFGSETNVAMTLGISKQAVNGWTEIIPEGAAYKLQVLTAGKLKVDPEVYPSKGARA